MPSSCPLTTAPFLASPAPQLPRITAQCSDPVRRFSRRCTPLRSSLLLVGLFLAARAAEPAVSDVPLIGDIDGDGKSDLIVWQRWDAATFRWVISSAAYSDVAAGSKQWGGGSDVPLIGDIDGDGKGTWIVWRPGTATFYWLTSSSGYSTSAAGSRQWGDFEQPDVPLLGDIDGDGKADLWSGAEGMARFTGSPRRPATATRLARARSNGAGS